MQFLYAARHVFDKSNVDPNFSWEQYVGWSRLFQVTELVSLDGLLNRFMFRPDYDNAEDWSHIHTDGIYISGFYTSLEYVLERCQNHDKFNLLTIVIEPDQDCKAIEVEGFYFLGYELVDEGFSISALTNCGGFDETFLPSELNQFGLIDNYLKAYDIKERLLKNNPEERHADTTVVAIWRHKTIGASQIQN